MPMNGVAIYNTISMFSGERATLRYWLRPRPKFNPTCIKIHAPITPNFPYGLSHEIVEDYVEKLMLAHHFSHYYSRRCQRMYLQHYFHAPGRAVLRNWLRPRPKFNPTFIKIRVPITPTFPSGLSHEIVGDYVEK
jgi:hypothetical protein